MAEYLDTVSISKQGQGSQSNTTSQMNNIHTATIVSISTGVSSELSERYSNKKIDRKHDIIGHSKPSQKGRRIQSARPPVTRVVSVKKRSLNEKGYKDLEHWLTNPNNVYIGRDMTHYVPGAVGSKWQNPFKEQDYPKLDTRLDMYKKHIETTKYNGKVLYEWLEELRGKTIGCWCKPDPCHGDVLIQMLKSKPIPETPFKPLECCSDLPNDKTTEGTVDRMPSCKNDINTEWGRDTKRSQRISDKNSEGIGKSLLSDMMPEDTRDKDSITLQRSDIKSRTGDDIPSHRSDIKSRTGDGIPSHRSDMKSRTEDGIPSHRSDMKSGTEDGIPLHRSDMRSGTGDGIPSHRSDIKSRTGDGISSHRSNMKSGTGDGIPSHRSDMKSGTEDGIPLHRSDVKSGTGDGIPSHRSDMKSGTGDGISSHRNDMKFEGTRDGIPSHRSDMKFEGKRVSKKSQRTRKNQNARPAVTRVVSVKKRSLNHQGYKDLEHWLTNPNNVYIGRDMTHYVPGAVGSKWQNPFKVDQHGRDKCIEMYKEYIQTDTEKYNGKTLLESLEELRGKTLGCWCSPDPCHGDVIVQLLKSKT